MPMQMTFTTTSTQPKSAPVIQAPHVMPLSSGASVYGGGPATMQFSALASYARVRTCGSCGGR